MCSLIQDDVSRKCRRKCLFFWSLNWSWYFIRRNTTGHVTQPIIPNGYMQSDWNINFPPAATAVIMCPNVTSFASSGKILLILLSLSLRGGDGHLAVNRLNLLAKKKKNYAQTEWSGGNEMKWKSRLSDHNAMIVILELIYCITPIPMKKRHCVKHK